MQNMSVIRLNREAELARAVPTIASTDRILVSAGVIAARLGVSAATVRRLVADEHHPLPAFRFTRSPKAALCIKESQLQAWLAECVNFGAAA